MQPLSKAQPNRKPHEDIRSKISSEFESEFEEKTNVNIFFASDLDGQVIFEDFVFQK